MRQSLGFVTVLALSLASALAEAGCSSGDAPAPSASASPSAATVTVPTGPPTKVGEKGLEITPTGKNSTGANEAPIFTVKNIGTKAVKSYALQVFVTDASGDKLAQQYPSVSPFNPIQPGASVEIPQGLPQSKGNKTEVIIWNINYADNTFWEDQGAQDKRPIKAAGADAASASPSASAAPAASPTTKGGAKK